MLAVCPEHMPTAWNRVLDCLVGNVDMVSYGRLESWLLWEDKVQLSDMLPSVILTLYHTLYSYMAPVDADYVNISPIYTSLKLIIIPPCGSFLVILSTPIFSCDNIILCLNALQSCFSYHKSHEMPDMICFIWEQITARYTPNSLWGWAALCGTSTTCTWPAYCISVMP